MFMHTPCVHEAVSPEVPITYERGGLRVYCIGRNSNRAEGVVVNSLPASWTYPGNQVFSTKYKRAEPPMDLESYEK